MKTSIKNKKGFTIVELVIVIAVIAILAAVLIPTFADLVKRANESVDIQIVRQMNLVLQAEEVSAGKPATVIDAKKILIANGCDDFTPSDSDNVYYWYSLDNRVILYNKQDSAVLFPNEYVDITIDASFYDLSQEYKEVIDVVPTEGQSLKDALIKAVNDAADGDTLRLPADSSAEMQQGGFYYLSKAIGTKQLTIDMNGSTFTSKGADAWKIKLDDGSFSTYESNGKTYCHEDRFTVAENGKLTIVNGKFDVEHYDDKNYAVVTSVFQVNTGATLVLNDVNIDTVNVGIFPAATASEVVIGNCKINAGYYAVSTNGLTSNGVRITINNSELLASTCVLVNTQSGIFINDSTLTGEVHALVVRCGYASVGNSTLITTDTIPGIFSYKALATNERGTWIDGNGFPAATLVAGDYSKSNSEGAYSYKGNVTVYLQNVKLQSADAAAVPNVLMAALDPDKTVALTYDSASTVDVLKIYGEDWVGLNTDTIQSQSATFKHNGTITVNGETKTLGD